MLSPELKKMVEENLEHMIQEIEKFKPSDHGHCGVEYLTQLKEHEALWMKFLGR